MRKIVVCFIFLVAVSCNKKTVALDSKDQVKQPNEHISKKDTINGNEYVFYFKKEKPSDSKNVYCNLDSLVILKNEKKYVLNLTDKNLSPPEYALTDFVYANNDYNFDGINDIMVDPHAENLSVYGNDYTAYYFLYNKKNDSFEESVQMNSMHNLDICAEGKYLFSNNGNSLTR
ncbi:MAG: hypothetical protein JNN23_08550, partial [Chryseobacterium gambrini]|nr:hypothetical protein [Chryseobacterium gambrini]